VRLYFDTSALLKLSVAEAGSEVVQKARGDASRVSTATIAYAEARAALARLQQDGVLSPQEHHTAVAELDGD
jgi:uncharacterized protein